MSFVLCWLLLLSLSYGAFSLPHCMILFLFRVMLKRKLKVVRVPFDFQSFGFDFLISDVGHMLESVMSVSTCDLDLETRRSHSVAVETFAAPSV